jgi:hypothetical protein
MISHRAVRSIVWCGPFLLLAASSAMGQVQVDVRLEKPRYLAGEPIVVVVDVRNVGDAAFGYTPCDGDIRLAVTGAARRTAPNIFGCFSGQGGGGAGCGVSHPPLLPPGQTTSFRSLLKDYDLAPGQYALTASGNAGVRSNEAASVPGARFDRTLSLTIAAASQGDLQAALAPLVSAADGADPVQRRHARAAIIESAPSSLDALIARFAAEEEFDASAIEALGRIGTASSRAHLKTLFGTASPRRAPIVLALARAADRDDAAFFATVLQDGSVDQTSRRYAALALGHAGGDQAVQHLERALSAAPSEIRPSIATALGNTRSRAAVPVLIGMLGNNPARSEVCGALRTLTHRTWCDGTADDLAAKRKAVAAIVEGAWGGGTDLRPR